MRRYAVTRILLTIPVIFGVAAVVFFAIRAAPGDVIGARLAEAAVSEEQIQQARDELGLDEPILKQFATWLGDVARGDLGESLWTGESTSDRLRGPLEVTLEIGVLSVLLGFLLGVPLGVISAVRRNSIFDYPSRIFAIAGLSAPDFFVALALVIFASRVFEYFPPIGFVSIWDDPLKNLEQVWMPVAVLGFRQSAGIARVTRSSVLEVMGLDYIRTAWAKGLSERVVVVRHALRNAMIAVVTLTGIQLGLIFGATVVVENVFALPGLGQLTLESVMRRDYTQLQANVIVLASFVVLANLIVDLTYGWLDPRIRRP